jgi:hypothetical protein
MLQIDSIKNTLLCCNDRRKLRQRPVFFDEEDRAPVATLRGASYLSKLIETVGADERMHG